MASDKKQSTQTTNSTNRLPLLFTQKNYRFMMIGLAVIFLGLLLMIGKNNTDPNAPFPAEEIYSFRRIVLAPFVVVLGFLIEVYSILLIVKKSN